MKFKAKITRTYPNGTTIIVDSSYIIPMLELTMPDLEKGVGGIKKTFTMAIIADNAEFQHSFRNKKKQQRYKIEMFLPFDMGENPLEIIKQGKGEIIVDGTRIVINKYK